MTGFTYIAKDGDSEIVVGGFRFRRNAPSKNVPTALIPVLDADVRFKRNDGSPPAPVPTPVPPVVPAPKPAAAVAPSTNPNPASTVGHTTKPLT